MKTKITELFGIEYPVILSGMSWISTPELVAAVCNSGGLGILATGILNEKETREAIHEVRKLTSKPFAANVTLYFPGAEKNAAVLIEEKVPVVNYALGKGDWLCKRVHEYGGKVIATVTTLKHALAAQNDGADAVIVTGHEAAGHGGDVTSLVLVPTIADKLNIPVIAAGGFADGRGLLAAIAMGAEAISMGTRFMNSIESPVHEKMKAMSCEKDCFSTVRTDKIDGMICRVVNNKGARRLMNKKLNPFSAIFYSKQIANMLGFPWLKLAVGIVFMGYKKSIAMARMAIGFKAFQVGTMDGDDKKGVLPLGQVTSLIKDTPTVDSIIKQIVLDAELALYNASSKIKM